MENMPYDEAIELSQDSQESLRADEKLDDRGPLRDAKGLGGEAKGAVGSKLNEQLTNNVFDEACELDDDSVSVDTAEGGNIVIYLTSSREEVMLVSYFTHRLMRQKLAMEAGKASSSSAAPRAAEKMMASEAKATVKGPPPSMGRPPAPAKIEQPRSPSSEGSDEEDEEDDESAGGEAAPTAVEGAYNPKDYENLNVSADVRDLFPYIERYNAHEVELDTTLKCFIPDYIPAVGEMDAFIKVPRPDADRDELGLTVLDEPAASQSDATVLELQLRAVSKKQHGDVAVRSIENAAKNPVEVDRWITSIAELHRARPPPQVNYRKPMPDMDKLMEEWPPEFEDVLRTLQLPNADLEASLPEFARLACAIMDVPVYDSVVESLHVLFSLYLEFSDNVHFAAMNNGPGLMDSTAQPL